MKRSRQDDTLVGGEEELGAVQFAAALNGDDPRLIWDSLKRFVKIVQHERRAALSLGETNPSQNNNSDSDDDASSSLEEEEDSDVEATTVNPQDETQKKRFKASESWKEDTNKYHVPFVGTSVAKGGRSSVVVGQWPTGLLHAYLERSTRAAELTGDHLIPPAGHVHKSLLRNKQGKLSQAIYKSYLKALAELVTAAIPKDVLEKQLYHNAASETTEPRADSKNTMDITSDNPRFLTAVLKEQLPSLLSLLQTDTNKGKGPCGPLVPHVLHILSNVAQTSDRNARQVARDLEQSLPENVWRTILRLPPQHKQQQQHTHNKETGGTKDTGNDVGNDDNNEKQSSSSNNNKHSPTKDLKREEGRTAVLQLARTLLSSKDSTVLHYIGSPGSKDRKVSAGILVLALRDGLRDTFHESASSVGPTRQAYYKEITFFLQRLRDLLCKSRNLLSTRRWVDILSHDVLQNLCDLSLHAPVLAKPHLYQTVLDATDSKSDNLSSLQEAGMEARRLLWPLLVDPLRSPLLPLVQQGKTNGRNNTNHNHNAHNQNNVEQNLVRTMCRLLDTHPPRGKLALHHCFCQGLKGTPALLSPLFQKLTVADSNKHPFSFLARLRFVSQVVREGPAPTACMTHTTIAACVTETTADPILRVVLPLGLKKNVFSKAIQSKNAMIVSETLKCLVCVLQRIETVKKEMAGIDGNHTFFATLSTKACALLPDVQVLLSTLSRFDLMGGDRAAPGICGHLCQLLLSYASVLPEIIREVKFDWIKLLPSKAEIFCGLPLILQVRLLQTLETLLTINKMSHVSTASYELLLYIMTTARAPLVHSRAKTICQLLLGHAAPSNSAVGEIQQCLKYEISCWVDCMTAETIAEFCSILEEASQLHFKSQIYLLQAWKEADLPQPIPRLPVSPILMAAMSYLSGGSSSNNMAALISQVTTKCLLYHDNPLALAALVNLFHATKKEQSKAPLAALVKYFHSTEESPLLQYAKSLVAFETMSESKREELLLVLVDSCFKAKSFHCRIVRLMQEDGTDTKISLLDGLAEEDAVAAIRQLLHMLACSSTESLLQSCFSLVRLLLPAALQGCGDPNDVLLSALFSRLEWYKSTDLKYIDLCALSSGREGANATTLRRVQRTIEKFTVDTSDDGVTDDILSTQTTRGDFMSLLLRRKFLSFHQLDDMLNALEGLIAQESSDSIKFPLLVAAATSCVQEMLTRSECGSSGSINPFTAWLATTDPKQLGSHSDASAILASNLEILLCRQFASGSAISAQLYVSTLKQEPRVLIERVLALRATNSPKKSEDTCLAFQLVECDPYRFAPALVGLLFSDESPKSFNVLWMGGALDKAILSVVNRGGVMKDMKDEGQKLVNALVHRSRVVVREMCNGKPDRFEKGIVFQLLQSIDRNFLVKAAEKVVLAEEITASLSDTTFHEILGQMAAPIRLSFLQATFALKSSLEANDQSSQASIRQSMDTCLFVRLCELLPRALRKKIKAMEANRSLYDIVNPSFLIDWLCSLAGDFHRFDLTLLASLDSTCIAAALRACLKYGMADSTSVLFAETGTQCLRLAREFVLGVREAATKSFPSPSDVYEMIVSHSHFAETLAGPTDEPGRESRKLELVYLLLTCVSKSTSTITFGAEVWDVLFSAYGAGLSDTDASLRRLLSVATKRQDAAEVPFLDQFRWSGVPLDNAAGAKDSRLWDWLANGLQLGRVRQTLRCFPLSDSLVPPPLAEIEVWIAKEVATDSHVMDIVVDEELSKSDIFEDLGETGSTAMARNRPANDASYSPGYILPLILAALESCVGNPMKPASEQARDNQLSNGICTGSEVLARMAQRLCEKGGLSLALASLCCKCPSLRQVAVSVISFFMWAIDSKEAREISSWRERPQLAMLLHSVHRALAVRRAILLAREETNNNKLSPDSPGWIVPILPGFSAIFLARTAFILTRAGDSMYAPLNRFFLSISREHGAFQDMNRLPAFITFLCSSSDEPAGQARNERLWALKLFRAGFLNEFCFKMVATCHAPELLLTTIYNYRMRTAPGGGKQQEDECVMLLQAVEAMVRCGSRQAAHQLIGRMGLLSWLRSVVESPVVEQIIPTRASRIAFLELLATSVRQATKFEAYCKSKEADNDDSSEDSDSGSDDVGSEHGDEEEKVDAEIGGEGASPIVTSFPVEISSLARPTLTLCLTSFSDVEPPRNTGQSDTLSTITVVSLEALKSLKSAFQSPSNYQQQNIRADGIELGSALEYISKIAASSSPLSYKKEAIEVLASLPMCPNASSIEDAAKFCLQVLEFITAASSDLPKTWVVHVLKRLCLIFQQHAWDNNGNVESPSNVVGSGSKSELLQKLLESRNTCFQWTESRDLWFLCLQHLLSRGMTTSDVVMEDSVAGKGEIHSQTIALLVKIKLAQD